MAMSFVISFSIRAIMCMGNLFLCLKFDFKALVKLKPLEFYGIPLEDTDNKWRLLEAPRDALVKILSINNRSSSSPYATWPTDIIHSLHKFAEKAYEIKSSDEDSWRFFFESVSHDTRLQQYAFDAMIKNLSPKASGHVIQVLEAGG